MSTNTKPANIIESFKILKGNTLVSIIFEPMWGIPFVLYNFYLSFYMRGQGITDKQIGYLISIGFVSATIFSLIAGVITDTLGRKKTTLIFDLISWPGAVLIYLVSNNFWMFAFAVFINGALRITAVSFNLMVIEDANSEQRIAAFNIINIINISAGTITPVAGLMVKFFGVIQAERFFLIFAAISMTLMMILRNYFYKETKAGQKILDNHKEGNLKNIFRKDLHGKTFKILRQKPQIIMAISVVTLFNMYIPIGTYSSLYYALYINEVLGIDKSLISILGGVNSIAMLIIFIFINPIIGRHNIRLTMIIGLILQGCSLLLIIIMPYNNFFAAIISVILFAVGFSIFKPFADSMLAEVIEEDGRSGIYSLVNTITSILSIIAGLIAGYFYSFNPRLLYVFSIFILCMCSIILIQLQPQPQS